MMQDYAEAGYFADDYAGDYRSTLSYAGASISFNRAPRYLGYSAKSLQQTLKNTAGSSFVYDPVVIEVTSEATWPFMTDAEITALKNFMFNTIPTCEYFRLIIEGTTLSYDVRFGECRITERHLNKGLSEVTVPLVMLL